jgi:hypothetical protein
MQVMYWSAIRFWSSPGMVLAFDRPNRAEGA